jgi:pantoate--beta-alanine ligase
MRILRTVSAMSAWSRALQREGVRIGLVPTMGALHAGHLSLIRTARLSCDAVIVSLFVNPAQFGPGEDFARYPRRLQADAKLCRAAAVDALFAPSASAMYPPGFQTSVEVRKLAQRWEGAARPGHFAGVATVVTKLFSVIRPEAAFFGQKDYQQTALIRQLTKDLNLGVRIVVRPTVRDRDGLALSSRNQYLSPAQREIAPLLHRALQAGQTAIRHGATAPAAVVRRMRAVLAQERAIRCEYLAVCDPRALSPVSRIDGPVALLGAIRIGSIRLIDNLVVRMD